MKNFFSFPLSWHDWFVIFSACFFIGFLYIFVWLSLAVPLVFFYIVLKFSILYYLNDPELAALLVDLLGDSECDLLGDGE